MESWIAWLVLAALLGLAEIMTTTLALGLLAVAAVVAAVVGGLGLSLPFQLAAFVLAAGAGLGIVRPLAVRHIRQPPVLKTGTSALVGRPAVVTQEVTALDGRVRIGGEVWSARSYDEAQVIPAGSTVDVRALPAGDSPVGCRQMIGNLWEWVDDTFAPYPDFVCDPYQEYSEPYFGKKKVLKGGAWTTRSRLIRATWRNFFVRHRRNVLAGFRTAAR